MQKNAFLFDFKKYPVWLNRIATIIALMFVLTFFLMAGFGLWSKLLMFIAFFIIIIILIYASYYLSRIIFSK